MIDIKKFFAELLTTRFWLDVDVSRTHISDITIAVIGLLSVVAGIVVALKRNRKGDVGTYNLLTRYTRLLVSFGVLELLWAFCAWEGANVIGTKTASAVILIIHLIWLFYIVQFQKGDYRHYRKFQHEQSRKAKYLQS